MSLDRCFASTTQFYNIFYKNSYIIFKTKYIERRLMLSLVNVISRLMWSHYESPFSNTAYYMKTTGYFYHSVIVIAFGLAQSDHIKRLLLYQNARNESPRNLWVFLSKTFRLLSVCLLELRRRKAEWHSSHFQSNWNRCWTENNNIIFCISSCPLSINDLW